MSHLRKIRVGVLRGGPSSEYEVSLKTGEEILRHLPKDKYDPIDIFISREGAWHVNGIERTPYDAVHTMDVIVNAMHGEYGEDGKVQAILDHMKVPYTGSTAFASALAMRKDMAKQALKGTDIKTPYWKTLSREEVSAVNLHELFRTIPHPSVIKPVGAGSSVGVSVVMTFAELAAALEKAFAVGDTAIIEEFVEGREATCGVVDHFRGERTYALLPIEIIPADDRGFFDYAAKYEGKSEEICPGNFDHDTRDELQRLARRVHELLGLRHYSRSDFIIHPKRGIYFLEVNTLPGLTSESLLPKSLRAVGSSLPEFLDHIITLAREKK
ncbi:MAG: D-alanine--D-alanine ligase [Candidatus Paceibacterota bacterium]|jgi:D-alanine-D-alanine ligase